MDPLAEKYYSISPYAWCANNPVNVVDLNGMDWYKNDSTGYYTWFEGNDEHDGYTYIGEQGSVLGDYEEIIDDLLINVYNVESLYSEGFTFDISPIDKGAIIPSKNGGSDFLDEFMYNNGPEFSILLSNHPYTQRMMKENFISNLQTQLYNSENIDHIYDNNQWYPWDVLLPKNYHMAPQFIGNYRYDGYKNSKNSEILNVISDKKSVKSLTYRIIPLRDRRNKNSSRIGNTYQFYIWTKKL